ncbi:hypothetical protein [Komagataeibacter sp. FNDCR2]|uniref:hypothetical protein n=1 Tax=Komagataeibacter sp. FNDCR2 TaxID=2878682 RepID=UPI001E28DD67|nr:hypothetical protein [Komagataeibacter sp. FNDCR2]MCE2576577.1 hypothetical protein [Komagataeibacter sp. FNDCR2]
MNRAWHGVLVVSVLALVVTVAVAIRAPHAVFPAWLAVCAAWIGWPLGSMALLLAHALSGGRWGELLRPGLRAGVATLPLGIPALVGVLWGAGYLYPWIRPDGQARITNGFYLNGPFALGRVVIYVLAWGCLGVFCLRGRDLGRVAPGGLIVLAFTFGFAAIDLTESLDPHFSSSAYGLIASAGAVLLAFAMAVLFEGIRANAAELRDLARLLLGLTVLWAYLDFMQFLIVWQSNLPVEAAWYAPRLRGGWGAVAIAIAGLHFLLPFVLLLLPPLQARRRVVVLVAGLLVSMEIVRNLWLVLPTWTPPVPLWGVPLSLAFLGGGSALLVLWHRGRERAVSSCPMQPGDARV